MRNSLRNRWRFHSDFGQLGDAAEVLMTLAAQEVLDEAWGCLQELLEGRLRAVEGQGRSFDPPGR